MTTGEKKRRTFLNSLAFQEFPYFSYDRYILWISSGSFKSRKALSKCFAIKLYSFPVDFVVPFSSLLYFTSSSWCHPLDRLFL